MKNISEGSIVEHLYYKLDLTRNKGGNFPMTKDSDYT